MVRKKKLNRRIFIQGATAGTGAALAGSWKTAGSAGRVLGANERVRLGFIGVGNRGSQLLSVALGLDDVEVVALCDVYQPYLARDRSRVEPSLLESLGGRIPRMGEALPGQVQRISDFRTLLDRKDIDAVVIATPDHWHALQTSMACQAGKDVYVEKPLTVAVREGRRMVEAAEANQRIVQVGLQRRSSPTYQELTRLVAGGGIGEVSVARAYRISNMFPAGIGRCPDTEPPDQLDWDMWLGPRPYRPYRENMTPYRFRWWQDFSSQVANWGVHYLDAIRWMLGEDAPVAVSAHGSHQTVRDDRTVPDTLEVVFEMSSGRLLVFGQYEASGGKALESGEIELRGTRGNLYCASKGYRIVPSEAGQFGSPAPVEPLQKKGGDGDDTRLHFRNFIDSVKNRRQCRCDLETGHRSNTFALLANIALQTKSRIQWDPARERIVGNKEANQLLDYPYRPPWNLT